MMNRITQQGMGRLIGLIAVVLALLAGSAARAENLVSVRIGNLPPLPASSPVTNVIPVGEQLVALTANGAWLLDAAKSGWTQVAWRPARAPMAAGAGGAGTVVLMAGPDGRTSQALRLSLAGAALGQQALKPMPLALGSARTTVLGDMAYITGIDGDGVLQLLSLDLADDQADWKVLPAFGRAGGVPTSIAAQNSTVLVTLADAAGQGDRMLRWRQKTGWAEMAPLAGRVRDGAVRATGQAHVLYLLDGGAIGAPQMWSFHTITSSWAAQGAALPVATGVATGWGNGLLWSTPGANATSFAYTELTAGTRLLKTIDWFVIIVYLVGMLGIGWYCYVREKRNSTADFFVGGRSIPFWAAGVSLYAANTSSISYIAIPAKAFETNWQYMTNNLIAVIALTFVAVAIVPLLRRLNLMSVFHYLEIRFHPAIRMLASLICILVQIGSRMSVILLLPSLAIATITGIDVVYSILLMGGFTIVYTAMGGMKAVVWTDFVQLFVKMGGALFAIGYIIYKLDGGVSEFVATSMAENKMKLFDFSWDLTQPTVWGFIFLVIFDVVLTFPKDQVLMQRALSTKSAPEATRSILTFAAISIPGGFIFYTIGTALFAFYQSHPERMNPMLTIDATFPLFIAAELPTGITGLIIAGILAAAMATLSGIMNSVATLLSVDFYEKLVKNPSPKKSVLFAEGATVATGLVGIGAALWLSRFNAHSLFDVSIELAGLLGGGFAGAYTLGMFTKRANWQGVALGIAGSTCLTTVAWTMNLVHPYFYLPISIMLCIVIGYLASYLFPAPTRSLAGLTIYAD